jgi:Signal transduction histidine kinase
MGVHTILFVPMLVAGRVSWIHRHPFHSEAWFPTGGDRIDPCSRPSGNLAIQLTRLSAQSRQSAVMAERNRMARDIHDTLAQGFTGVIVQLEAVEEAMSQNQAAKASGHLNQAGDLARESLREARRSVQALRPQALEEKQLSEALKDLIRENDPGHDRAREIHFARQTTETAAGMGNESSPHRAGGIDQCPPSRAGQRVQGAARVRQQRNSPGAA